MTPPLKIVNYRNQPIKYLLEACDFCCGLYLTGYAPFNANKFTQASNGYDENRIDQHMLEPQPNSGILVSVVPPDPNWQPGSNEQYIVHTLPTGHKLHVSALMEYVDCVNRDAEDDGTYADMPQYSPYVDDTVDFQYDAVAIEFPSIGRFEADAWFMEAKYVFIVETIKARLRNSCVNDYYEVLYTSDWIHNLSYPKNENPRLKYSIFMRKD